MNPTDYGVLTGLVDDIGALLAASLAIMATFKGRARWEPCEEDLPKGPIKIVGALTAVGVGLLYAFSQTSYNFSVYVFSSLGFSLLLLVGFLGYILLITMYTFDREVASKSGADVTVSSEKIIGGFSLTPEATTLMKSGKVATVQQAFHGAAYNPDIIWSAKSRAFCKISFVLAYFAVVLGGCLSLASVAIILNQLPK